MNKQYKKLPGAAYSDATCWTFEHAKKDSIDPEYQTTTTTPLPHHPTPKKKEEENFIDPTNKCNTMLRDGNVRGFSSAVHDKGQVSDQAYKRRNMIINISEKLTCIQTSLESP